MAWPSYEDVTREVIRRLQVALGTAADVYGAGGATAIEVVTPDGVPTREVHDKPKLSVVGPMVADAPLPQPPVGERGVAATDEIALTYTDVPAPLRKTLTYTLAGYGTRDTTSASGAKGIQWLMGQVDLFTACRSGAPYLLGADWPADAPDWPGYTFRGTPARRMESAGGLHAFSATLIVDGACLTDGSEREGYLVADGGAEIDVVVGG